MTTNTEGWQVFNTFLPSVRFVVNEHGDAVLHLDPKEVKTALRPSGALRLSILRCELPAFVEAAQKALAVEVKENG